ncbi:V-type ATP synthase subunit H domain protein [Ancylostoma caninum]|uniref:V-type ATP synthase subunit H domain protein n=1 Tax=Ancylostoma caninum TaxID=29170 RepID=A0A368F4X4_ANCCA|nr:V-type ATP synthase subunit H domain protein [Ancylostoma caninum]
MSSSSKESINSAPKVNEAANEIHEKDVGGMNGSYLETRGEGSMVETQEEPILCTEVHSEKPHGDAAAVSRSTPSVQERSPSPAKVVATEEAVAKGETRSNNIVEPVAKKAKLLKKKEAKPVEKTVLADGEASVEEILSTFCLE